MQELDKKQEYIKNSDFYNAFKSNAICLKCCRLYRYCDCDKDIKDFYINNQKLNYFVRKYTEDKMIYSMSPNWSVLNETYKEIIKGILVL